MVAAVPAAQPGTGIKTHLTSSFTKQIAPEATNICTKYSEPDCEVLWMVKKSLMESLINEYSQVFICCIIHDQVKTVKLVTLSKTPEVRETREQLM